MATPFYSKADQEIYASGNKFIPQERYRLGPYTPPEIMGQNTNTGITNTQAAGSYMGYPSYEAWLLAQGGGGGNGGGNDPVDNTNRGGINQNLGPTNITDYEAEAYGVGPTFKGTIARLQDAYSKLPTPGNLIMKGIRHWKGKRDARRVEEAAASKAGKDAADAAAPGQGTNIGGGWTQTNTGGGGATFTGGGGQTHQGFSNTPAGFAAAAESEGTFAQGGRIGYERGRVVNPGGYQGEEEGVDSVKHFIMLEQMDKLEKMIGAGLDSDGRLQARLDQLLATSTTGFGTGPDLVLPDDNPDLIPPDDMAQGGIARLL